MLQELRACPFLFYSTGVTSVMAIVSEDASSLMVSVSAAGGNFSKVFSVEALDELARGTNTPFFTTIKRAFHESTVSIEGDGRQVRCNHKTDSVSFDLDTTTTDVQKSIFDALLEYHHAFVHLKETEQSVQSETTAYDRLSLKVKELQREEEQLQQQIQRCHATDKQNEAFLAELEKKITASGRSLSTIVAKDDTNADGLICRARNPLGRRERKDVDAVILRLVKSSWCGDDNGDQKVPWNVVIRPYTTSEFAQYTKQLTDKTQTAIWAALQKIDQWDYDVFSLQEAMSGDTYQSLRYQPRGGSLLVTMYALLFRHNLIRRFSLDENVLLNWVSIVEAGYHPNPYHNSMHAADVLHITHFILTKGGLAKHCNLTEVDMFAALFAAAIHDYDHPGINNNFHIKARTYYSLLYNDRSVLENHHIASVFELMKLSRYNILATLTDEQRRDLRDTVVELVLATDMGVHAKYVATFKRRLQETRDFTKKDDARLAMAMALKMADISNCGRPLPLYLKWSGKISDEFYMQGDRERSLGITVSPFMNRQTPAMAQGQISFMSYVIIPLFEVMAEFLPPMRFSVDHVEVNKQHWMTHEDT